MCLEKVLSPWRWVLNSFSSVKMFSNAFKIWKQISVYQLKINQFVFAYKFLAWCFHFFMIIFIRRYSSFCLFYIVQRCITDIPKGPFILHPNAALHTNAMSLHWAVSHEVKFILTRNVVMLRWLAAEMQRRNAIAVLYEQTLRLHL